MIAFSPRSCVQLILAWLLLLALVGRSSAAETDARAAAKHPVTFEKTVRPILKAHCFPCHGEDGKREGGLDVRLRRWLVKGGDSGAAIEPGQPEESLLLERVQAGEMPPGNKKLSPKEIAALTAWVRSGAATARPEPQTLKSDFLITAEERSFWSFQPIRAPRPPQVAGGHSLPSPIDRFVLARLQARQLKFSPPADRRTLIRRMTFDLLGIPPTPAEVEAFVRDDRPDAIARLVDRLLASPQYGERWGRHWLDVAGYADSEGYTERDQPRPHAYRYRDYVVQAMNHDKRFDQFVLEQLAGDELVPPPHRNLTPEQVEQLTATGFLRMAPDGTGQSGVNEKAARNEVLADTLKIVSTSLLGLTVGCARCHNHRYDPISQRDYYELRAIFEPALDWKKWRPPGSRRISLYTQTERALRKKIEAEAAVVDAERAKKAAFYIERTLTEELAGLPEPLRAPLRKAYRTAASKRTAKQKALLKKHPSVAKISEGSLYLYDRRRDAKARKLDAQRRQKEKRFVQQTRQKAIAEAPAETRDALRTAAAKPAAKRTAEAQALLKAHPAAIATLATLARFNPAAAREIEADKKQAERLRKEKAAADLKRYQERAAKIRERIPREGFIRALTEPPNHAPPTYLFVRGDHDQPKQRVLPSELAVLSGPAIAENAKDLPTTGRRLAYARHLVSGRHPLVGRVLVNRIWMHHFGRGLVRSPGDFGMLGERPTHPLLLDYLASELVRGDWSIKRLHRLLLTSRTYQQSSRRRADLERVDPDNRWLGRMPLRRLDAESVRDSILAVSGALHFKMFGPPAPVMEDEVGQIVIGVENLDGERKPTKRIDLQGEEFRRSLYVQVRRSRPLAVLETFDRPAMTPNCTQRQPSNVAPQPLLMMNSQFAVQYAERFAARLMRECGDNRSKQITRAWRLAFAEPPTDAQQQAAVAYLKRQEATYQNPTGQPTDGSKPKPADKRLSQQECRRRALSSFCQAILSSNRFLYVD